MSINVIHAAISWLLCDVWLCGMWHSAQPFITKLPMYHNAQCFILSQQHLLFDCRAAARMCMHHYVNNMDIVPRLLGATRLNKLIESMLRVLPAGSTGQLASSLSSVISRAGDFVPFGQYHLVLGASLRSVDAAVDQAALLFSWKQAVDFLSKVGHSLDAA